MATFYQRGNALDYTPDADVTAGEVVVVGGRALVAIDDIKSGRLGALATREVYKFARAATSGADIAAGTAMYWDAGEEEPTTNAETGSNKKIGYAFGDLAAADTEWLIELAP